MLKGLKVIQFQGLAPSVFCGMYFADQGADVYLISRPEPAPFSMRFDKNILNRNKKCITLSIKKEQEKKIIIQMIKKVDVIIDPFRPGVLQKQHLGPEHLYQINPRIVLLRVSGFGQHGDMALKPGHDLNYTAESGVLHLVNRNKDAIQFPANYLADFVSASLGIIGTLNAIGLRNKSNEGSVVDCSLAGGCTYLTSLVKSDKSLQVQGERSEIRYFAVNGKRYVATYSQKSHQIPNQRVYEMITKMQKMKISFLKEEAFQIAEIKKVPLIKDSQLRNPFKLPDSLEPENNLPSRDGNRNEILNVFKIQNAKL